MCIMQSLVWNLEDRVRVTCQKGGSDMSTRDQNKPGKKDARALPESEPQGSLSRRDLFTAGAAGAAVGFGAMIMPGSGAAAQDAGVNAEDIEWDYEADVVVIGAGATGLPAAIRARDQGASVIIVEQGYDGGGKATHSGGWVSI